MADPPPRGGSGTVGDWDTLTRGGVTGFSSMGRSGVISSVEAVFIFAIDDLVGDPVGNDSTMLSLSTGVGPDVMLYELSAAELNAHTGLAGMDYDFLPAARGVVGWADLPLLTVYADNVCQGASEARRRAMCPPPCATAISTTTSRPAWP